MAKPQTLDFTARDTLTVAKLNHGDKLRFTLKNGQTRTFILQSTSAQIIEDVKGGVVYSFECQLLCDGQPLTLRRYVCTQESFYEPWVVNGVRIWFSHSAAIFKLVPVRIPENHEKFDADAILALQDATLLICPQPMQPWFPIKEHFIDVGTCYNGDDPWLGPYLGRACHVGLDINMPRGTPLLAPIDFDDQYIFSADHRWRGIRRWPDGEYWALQSHHVDKLLIEQNMPLKAGTHYGEAAGKGIGSHEHSHFEFRVGPDARNRGEITGTEVDPWILFWQIFENDKARKKLIRAAISPVAPARTGEPVTFKSTDSRLVSSSKCTWAFGDGGVARGADATYTFARPGVWPVTLVIEEVESGARATQTAHITITGEPSASPTLVLDMPDEVSFRPRPQSAADINGGAVGPTPREVTLTAGAAKTVFLRNIGGGVLPKVKVDRTRIHVKQIGEGNEQKLELSLVAGSSRSSEITLPVECPDALNSPQVLIIRADSTPVPPAAHEVVVDDKDPGFHATPSFWVGHQLLHAPQRGHKSRYLTNGQRATPGCIARFTPTLAAARYEVLLHDDVPLRDARFPVRIRHASGEARVRFTTRPDGPRTLGVYAFAAGSDNFVEFQAENSTGLIVADALIFRPTDQPLSAR